MQTPLPVSQSPEAQSASVVQVPPLGMCRHVPWSQNPETQSSPDAHFMPSCARLQRPW